jgi:hypothetical protein
MKTIVLAPLILIVLIGTGAAQLSQTSTAGAASAQHLTQEQAARLVNTARTPEDHRELSRYFRQEAEQKRKKEQYYTEVAATYRLHPPRVDAYRNVSTADYYQHLADEARSAALADDQIAKLQDKLAEDMVQPK